MFTINLEGKEIAKSVVDLFSPLTEFAGAIGDQIRIYRKLSVLRALHRAKLKADEQNLTLEPPPLKFLIPYLEQVSLEDEKNDILNELWSNLLLSSAVEFKSEHNLFIRILGELSPKEAKFFQYIAEYYKRNPSHGYLHPVDIESNWDNTYFYIAIRDLLKEFKDKDLKKIDFSNFYSKLRKEHESQGSIIHFFTVFAGEKEKYPYDTIFTPNRTEYDDLLEYIPLSMLKGFGLISEFNSPEYWFNDIAFYMKGVFLTPLGYSFYKSCIK